MTAHFSGDLTKNFDVSRLGTGLELEEIRHNYYVAAKMNGEDEASIGGISINTSGRNNDTALSKDKDKEKQATRDMIYLALLNDIDAMERSLSAKYGEDFAENLAAEHLDKETYMQLMAIDDKDERRRQIALALKQGVEDGTIDADVLYTDIGIQDWVEARASQQDYDIVMSKSEPAPESLSGEDTHNKQENSGLSSGLNAFLGS